MPDKLPKHSCSATWEEVGWRDHTQDDIMRAIMRGSRGTANPAVVRQLLKEQFAFKVEKKNA